MEGECHAYLSDETPMETYLNVHYALQNMRNEAKQTGKPGPRVLVVGGTDAGKSTLCHMLCSWAARQVLLPLHCLFCFSFSSPFSPERLLPRFP